MSDIFENDIDEDAENLEALEDSGDVTEAEVYEFDVPLFCLKLEYSNEILYAKNDKKLEIAPGDKVIVPTKYGDDMATVLGNAKKSLGVKPSDIITVIRKASKADLKQVEENKKTEQRAAEVFVEKVAKHKLDMKLVAVHFLADEQKALFFFSAETRIDFRELVKDLVSVFRLRIELRQIGPRDEARFIGGLGICGRPLCCHKISDKMRSVSMKMAKDQNLSLNSSKISGQCGRLLCCLAYEFCWYNEARRKLPAEGMFMQYDGTSFRITEVNPLTSMIKMTGDDGRILEVNSKRFFKDNGKWKIN